MKHKKWYPAPKVNPAFVELHCVECGRAVMVLAVEADETTSPTCEVCIDNQRAESEGYFCVMCGREWGISEQKDGKLYCSMCWTIWTS